MTSGTVNPGWNLDTQRGLPETQEIADKAWWVFDSTDEDPFVSDAQNLWSDVLRRQGGPIAMFATLPEDPGLN